MMGRKRKNRGEITSERLKALYDYDPETGVFTRKDGCLAPTTPSKVGYLRIGIDGRRYYQHRLAWLHFHGEWPKQIDHINRDKTDNRIANLRECSQRENTYNRPAINPELPKGVCFNSACRRNPYLAYGSHDGRTAYLGARKTPEAAKRLYDRHAKEVAGEFASD